MSRLAGFPSAGITAVCRHAWVPRLQIKVLSLTKPARGQQSHLPALPSHLTAFSTSVVHRAIVSFLLLYVVTRSDQFTEGGKVDFRVCFRLVVLLALLPFACAKAAYPSGSVQKCQTRHATVGRQAGEKGSGSYGLLSGYIPTRPREPGEPRFYVSLWEVGVLALKYENIDAKNSH